MLTKENFLQLYENSNDEELYNLYLTIEDYSSEAQEAIKLAVLKGGGLENIKDKLKKKELIQKEEERIKQEAAKLYVPESDLEFLKKMINSDILSKQRVEELIDTKHTALRIEEEDKKVKPRTIFGSFIGGVVASIIGGVLWGLQMIQMHRMFLVLGIGLVLLCYGIIKFSTKQTKQNPVVFIATILSVIASLIIGQLLFELFGEAQV